MPGFRMIREDLIKALLLCGLEAWRIRLHRLV
jgi:hypothetical protein